MEPLGLARPVRCSCEGLGGDRDPHRGSQAVQLLGEHLPRGPREAGTMIQSREPEWEAGALAYDEIASRYDRVPQENRINRLMRAASLARIAETFPPGSRVLELGCGTGDE